MCGINGVISKRKLSRQELIKIIQGMNNLIIHRGPDDNGVFAETNPNASIALGMRRLSIIDIESGNQPMNSEDKNITIVFNGEIYNFIQLRQYLVSKGVKFNTKSDTEVILKLYETEGVSSFKKLDGMFAFSIYDKNINKVFIVRDFFGEKPLYYTSTSNNFIWGSELKSIINTIDTKPDISIDGLNLFLRLTYIPAPYTIYEDCHKLEANHYLSYDIDDHSFEIYPISNTKETGLNKKISFKEAVYNVKDLIYQSVESRSISDVPLGTFLSGGVDSSVVSLCLAQSKSTPINTFSIGFKNKVYDESEKSRTVANIIGSDHHEFIIDEKDLEEDVHNILTNFDEPFADSSALPTFLVSKKTKEHVTVALTGDGGDEVFGGYNKYYMGKFNKTYTNVVPRKVHNFLKEVTKPLLKVSSDNRGLKFKTKRLLNSFDYNGQFYYDIISLGFTNNHLKNILKNDHLDSKKVFDYYIKKTNIQNPDNLTDFRNIDKLISLEGDMLVKVDRTSMLNSLECRAPFLNKKIWEFTNSIPENFLLKGWNKKYILKEAFKSQFPKDFLNKSKSGFGVPVGDWLKTSLKLELLSYINEPTLIEQDIFNVQTTKELVLNHLNGKDDNSFKVWTFYCFQKWYYNTYSKI
ncbi:asparagine synthase (glutamine-hydrolyzing) [Gaetbulibacter sp. M240]|uniref:asparagine synthase (glutamine-hydrolyzing) n=1 Tax=Gaetbulibacter sp. M240 TaxID=3126511 RepID=UPI00374EAA35